MFFISGPEAAGDKQRTLNEFRQQVFNEEGYVICRFEQQSIVKPHPVRLFSLAMEEIVVVKVGKKMEMIGKIPLGNSQLAPVDSVIHDLGSNRLDLDDNYEVAVEIVEACEDEGFVTTVCINYGIVRGKTDSYYFYTSVRWPARPEGVSQHRQLLSACVIVFV